MNLESALKQYFNLEISGNKEKTYKIIAGYIADQEANFYQMSDRERDDNYNRYRDEIEAVDIESRKFRKIK